MVYTGDRFNYLGFFRFWDAKTEGQKVESEISDVKNEVSKVKDKMEDMQKLSARLGEIQAEELDVEKDLASVQKRSEKMQIEAMGLIKALEDILSADRNVHQRK
jgi:hypothetical protein